MTSNTKMNAYVSEMKKNFDIITIQKRSFDALVNKPIEHTNNVKQELQEMIKKLDKKI